MNPGLPLAKAVPQPMRVLDSHDVIWSLAFKSLRFVSKPTNLAVRFDLGKSKHPIMFTIFGLGGRVGGSQKNIGNYRKIIGKS